MPRPRLPTRNARFCSRITPVPMTTFLPTVNSFSTSLPRRGETTIYHQPWRDGLLTGAAQPAIRLPFAFRRYYLGNAYDLSKDLSTSGLHTSGRPPIFVS